MLILVSIVGAAGNIFLKMGTNRLGEINPKRLLDARFLLKYTFSRMIFAAMIAFFSGRLIIGSPISVLGAGQVTISVTVGTQILTIIMERIILGQRYSPRTYIGLVVGIICLVLVLNPQR